MKNAPRVLIVLAMLSATPAWSEVVPSPGSFDSRIRTVTYNPNEVVLIRGYYGFAQVIEFSSSEKIENIAIGDSLAWQVSPNEAGNRLFLKPVEQNAQTNLVVITDKRSYAFELVGSQGRGGAATYTVRFRYPQDIQAQLQQQFAKAEEKRQEEVVPDNQVSPEQWNLEYSFQGDPKSAPLHVFDDGKFTYFQFRDRQEVPAIFLVGEDQNESLINFHVRDKYVVIQRTGQQFTLRYAGGTVVCVFNDESFAE